MNETIPAYIIYDRYVPIEHARVATFLNPIGPTEDKREESEKTVAGCEGGACLLSGRPDFGQPLPNNVISTQQAGV
jgi:hypothetical protein